MLPLEGVVALLRQLEALGLVGQLVGLGLPLASYGLLLFAARRIGKGDFVDLEEQQTKLNNEVAESSAKLRELRDRAVKLEEAIENLQAQRPEERLLRAAKEREEGNEEVAIQLYQEVLVTFGPDLARCCEAIAACGGDDPGVERYRALAIRLAGTGIRQ